MIYDKILHTLLASYEQSGKFRVDLSDLGVKPEQEFEIKQRLEDDLQEKGLHLIYLNTPMDYAVGSSADVLAEGVSFSVGELEDVAPLLGNDPKEVAQYLVNKVRPQH
jgi:hypothetical protein